METRPDLPEDVVRAFAASFEGTVVRPDDDAYDGARRVWNGMVDRYPALVVRPTTSAAVAAALALAQEHGLLVAVRGGGHNVAGSGTCDSGLVIDLGALADVAVDASAGTIRAGGGATWRVLDTAAAEHGLGTPGGLVSSTGVGGLTLGGGIGWLSRAYGLACDNLESVEVVTVEGRVVTASETEHPDLFWALRGGGGNFGVATAFTFRGHPVTEVLGGVLLSRGERADEVLEAYAEWAPGLPEGITTLGALLTTPPAPFVPPELQGRPAVGVVLCHVGDPDEGAALVDQLRKTAPPDVDAVGALPYTVLQSFFDEGVPRGQRNYWRSGYLASLDADLLHRLARAAGRAPTPFAQIHLHQLGGAIARGSAGSAFAHRDAAYAVNVIGAGFDPAEDDASVGWVRETWRSVEPATSGVYVNFLGDEGADRVRAAYDPATWERLRAVKRAWDPTNVLRVNHNVPPA